jgi:hypothetical protein
MTRGSEEKAPEQKAPEQKTPKQKAPAQKAPARGKGPGENGDKRGQILRLRTVVLAFAGVVLGVLLARDDGSGDDAGKRRNEAGLGQIVSPAELSSLSASSPSPIYWAGKRPDTELELTEEEGTYGP